VYGIGKLPSTISKLRQLFLVFLFLKIVNEINTNDLQSVVAQVETLRETLYYSNITVNISHYWFITIFTIYCRNSIQTKPQNPNLILRQKQM
jgi:hypothetical protein